MYFFTIQLLIKQLVNVHLQHLFVNLTLSLILHTFNLTVSFFKVTIQITS